ncbi:MAG: methyltransferase domain-containing protein [Gordonia sp. (in: high G+C Gram-positive bacteria)]|uniref:class I SAM-dependent methyltransferase n=1 Tax=Gordonia sp. (in: high G+C Gram-positive bacteria) TaxID=84139 RepID=UPI0039E54DB5
MSTLQEKRTALVKGALGEDRYHRLISRYVRATQRPRIGGIDFGDLASTEPVCREFGNDRGRPLDRYYIENFMERSAPLITGRVLEVGERLYTEKYGQGVEQSDMCNYFDIPDATYVADLTDAPQIPDDTYDCVIITQTMQFIYDVQAATATLRRILKPGGVVLCTVPGLSQIGDPRWAAQWYWNFTQCSAERLFGDEFGPDQVSVDVHGNVFAATAFLQGVAWEETSPADLDVVDPEYPVILAVRATKKP